MTRLVCASLIVSSSSVPDTLLPPLRLLLFSPMFPTSLSSFTAFTALSCSLTRRWTSPGINDLVQNYFMIRVNNCRPCLQARILAACSARNLAEMFPSVLLRMSENTGNLSCRERLRDPDLAPGPSGLFSFWAIYTHFIQHSIQIFTFRNILQ